jgi:hypothetical protein
MYSTHHLHVIYNSFEPKKTHLNLVESSYAHRAIRRDSVKPEDFHLSTAGDPSSGVVDEMDVRWALTSAAMSAGIGGGAFPTPRESW